MSISVYITSSDGEYIYEKLGREPSSKELVEALLEKLSKQ
jgi:hypothetical protein